MYNIDMQWLKLSITILTGFNYLILFAHMLYESNDIKIMYKYIYLYILNSLSRLEDIKLYTHFDTKYIIL